MASKKVDINTANLQDFAQLSGIGVRKAQAIIKYRKVSRNGQPQKVVVVT
jgi:competence ComEA-like helix-hairpin-helix protein